MGFYGRCDFSTTKYSIKELGLLTDARFSIERCNKLLSELIPDYLLDAGLMSDPESLLQIFKYSQLIQSIFESRYCQIDDFDTMMCAEECCQKLWSIALMGSNLPLDMIFTISFEKSLFEDLDLIVADLKTVEDIYA